MANLGLHCSHVTYAVFVFIVQLIYDRMNAYVSCALSEQKGAMKPVINIYTKHGHWSLDASAAINMKVLLYPYMRKTEHYHTLKMIFATWSFSYRLLTT